MVPLPVALYSMIANPLQLLVSQVATSMLNVIGIPVALRGNMITLPGDIQLFVAEACSGMRQLTGFLALTTAWAYLSARPAWNRALLVALVDPDRDDGQRRPGDADRRHHLLPRPEVRLGGVPHRRGAGDDGPGPADAGHLQLGARPGRRSHRPAADAAGAGLGPVLDASTRSRPSEGIVRR